MIDAIPGRYLRIERNPHPFVAAPTITSIVGLGTIMIYRHRRPHRSVIVEMVMVMPAARLFDHASGDRPSDKDQQK
jgi:hypothetical protein